MIKLTNILNELNINRPITLSQLERWQNEIEASNDPTTKRHLALKCVESVLFIFEREHPNEPRPRNAINAAKTYLNDPSKENKQKCKDAAAATSAAAYHIADTISIIGAAYYIADAAADAAIAAVTDKDYYTIYAANSAIAAFKKYNILNELNINNPNITAEKAYKYWQDNIYSNTRSFYTDESKILYNSYKQICTLYCEKYDIYLYLGGLDDFEKLSQPELYQLYREMRTLVRKYVGKEIL